MKLVPFLIFCSLLALAATPLVPTAAAEGVCTPTLLGWAYECAGLGDGCTAWTWGVVGTCVWECITPECADLGWCDDLDKRCLPDHHVCVDGEYVRPTTECWFDAGARPCGDGSELYVRVLKGGWDTGCLP